ILTDPNRRRAYNARLSESIARGDCCPSPRCERIVQVPASVAVAAAAQAQPEVTRRPTARVVTSSSHPLSKNSPAAPALTPSGRAPGQAAARKQNSPQQPAAARVSPAVARHPKELPISWVGVVAALLIVTTLIIWWLFAQGNAAS